MARQMQSRPLLLFSCLTCLCSWWVWPLYLMGWSPSPLFGAGPGIAAIATLSLTEGRPGLMRLWESGTRWSVGGRWYAFAFGMPVLASITAAALNIVSGADLPGRADLARWPVIPQMFVLFFLIPGIGGTWEEPGFRGYALPRLRRQHSLRAASWLLGLGWVVWHLPLFVYEIIYWPDALLILASSIVFAWVFDATKSVLVVMVLHTMNNAVGVFFTPMFSGDDAVRRSILLAGSWAVVALIVWVRTPAFRVRGAPAS